MLLFAGVLLCAALGCANKRKDLAAIRDTYAAGKYEETVLLCDRTLRGGVEDGEVYYFCGMSLLALGRDPEAHDRFERALRADSALSGGITGHLIDKAEDARAGGAIGRAARLARTAAEFDGEAPVGSLKYLVAGSYFEEKDWKAAARWYAEAIAEYPDTDAAESAYFNLAACLSAVGDSSSAIEALEKQLSEYPRGTLASRAGWTLANLLYDKARSDFIRGDYETAVRGARRVIDTARHTVMIQKAGFLLGESYERMGDFDSAYEQYRAIAGEDDNAPGGIAERARAKIRALRDAGLR